MPANWFWQPDKTWVNEVNTTSLRSISGIRMAIFFVLLGGLAFGWATYQAFPWSPEPCVKAPCLEPLARVRAGDFAKSIFDSMGLFLTAVMGIAVGAYGVKRATDTDHKVQVEAAKAKGKAEGEAAANGKATKEHAVPTATTVEATGAESVKVTTAPAELAEDRHPTTPTEPVPEGDGHEWAQGEPRGGIL
jgi:hypothetical protein